MNTTQAMQRLRDVIRRQHKALSTEESYVSWLRRYMAAIRRMPDSLPSEKKVERFLSDLARRRDVAASTQNQAFNAIAFFYKDVLGIPLQAVDALRATRPAHLRHAPTVQETLDLMQSVGDVGGYPTNLIARLLYGCGLRVTEPLNLRIKDVDLPARRLCTQGSQGRQGSPRIPAPCAHGRTDPASGVCPGSLATGRAEQDSADDSGATGSEISRISMGLALGLAVPLTLSLPPPAHGQDRPLSDARSQCSKRH